jgi:hypothetical protein
VLKRLTTITVGKSIVCWFYWKCSIFFQISISLYPPQRLNEYEKYHQQSDSTKFSYHQIAMY